MTEKNAFANLLDSIVQRKVEQDTVAGMSNESGDGVSGTLPLPATQDIQPEYIRWEWTDPHVFVNAFFDKENSGYYIEVNGITINADQARILGEVLLSASRWQDIWQAHAGFYLAHGGRIKASPNKADEDNEPHDPNQC